MASDNTYTVKQITLCTALCAGFAYASYRVTQRILKYRSSRGKSANQSVLLSIDKSIQTDANCRCETSIGKTYDVTKTVRERIKELNLHAQQYKSSGLQFSPEFKPRSPVSSPWSSPRIIGSAKYLSFSAENISNTSPLASPERKRSKSPAAMLRRDGLPRLRKSSYDYTGMYDNVRNPELSLKTLNSLNKIPREMTLFEVRNIVSLLYTQDEMLLIKTLSTVSNCAAFKNNQEHLCDAGCPDVLEELLHHHSEPVRVAAVQVISNLAVIEKSHKFFRSHIPILLNYAINSGELLKTLSLTALANLALDSFTHKLMLEKVGSVLLLVENGSSMVQLQALRLLVNLSCNKDVVPFLLICKVSSGVFSMENVPSDREIALRILTFLANIVTYAAQDFDISSGSSHTLVALIYNLKKRTDLADIATSYGDDEDIHLQMERLHDALENKWS